MTKIKEENCELELVFFFFLKFICLATIFKILIFFSMYEYDYTFFHYKKIKKKKRRNGYTFKNLN